MDDQQPSFHIIDNTQLIWKKVQRLFRKEVHCKLLTMEAVDPSYEGDEIV